MLIFVLGFNSPLFAGMIFILAVVIGHFFHIFFSGFVLRECFMCE